VIEKGKSRVGKSFPAEIQPIKDTGSVVKYAIDMACPFEKAKCLEGRSR
jgi:hypothetical protein